ncbi:MAG: hypothetical protein KJ914_07385 [Gammaproteobacteria bacterium]|nr:hypothetical protein [Gammaproteobacteria bacterium]MBU1722771.1 hypothetical protein [Gammaproteobacteria bacterium]MBU2005202.1 hypothetical protein [Gammaproteobacteria bacterium]
MKTFIAVCCLLLLSLNLTYADEGGWVVRQNEDGILVQQQQTGSPHETTRGVVETETTLDALVALLKDVEACPRWVHACKEGRLVATLNPSERIAYSVLDSPFPLQDRDMYIYSTVRYKRKQGTIVINLRGRENHAPVQPGRTRVLDLQGSWVFQQVSPGHVRVSYQIQANPQAPFNGPSNDHMAESVFKTLQNLREVVKEPKYRDARFSEEEIRSIEVK